MGLWLVPCKALCGGSGGGNVMTSLWKVLEDAIGGGEEETPEDKRPEMPRRPWWVGFFPRSPQTTACTCLSFTSVSAVRRVVITLPPAPCSGENQMWAWGKPSYDRCHGKDQ